MDLGPIEEIKVMMGGKTVLGSLLLVLSSSALAQPVPPAGDEPSDAEETAAVHDEGRLVVQETLVVTATSHEEAPAELPFLTESLTATELRSTSLVRTLPEALGEVGGIMVQKTSHGQGSPYLRGFTGFRTVFLIDGIRLNNSVLREGPNQYWNTVDAYGVDRLEVVHGPGSVLYGSDAIGGTVQALTRQALTRQTLTGEPGSKGVSLAAGSVLYRYASAERSSLGHLDLAGSLGPKWSYSFSGSIKDFGDLEAGGGQGRLPRTGYDEWDLSFKLRYALAPDTELVAAYQQVSVDDAWRTHRTIFGRSWRGTTVGNEKQRILDQGRTLAYLQLHHDRPGPFWDALTASLSLHRQEEDRDRIRADDQRDLQGFDVATLGAWVRFEKASRFGLWTYGVETYRDHVDSFRQRFAATGQLTGTDIQGPVADDASYRLSGVYIQNELPMGKRLRWILGARYSRAEADAAAVEDPLTGDQIRVVGDWDQVVGSARFMLPLASGRWRLFGGLSQAFRAPNLSDLTRFDSARSQEIETPSPGLEPENFLSYELGVRVETARSSVELVAFHTEIDDMIVRVPTGAIIDGDFEVTKANGGDGFSRGWDLKARTRWGRHLSAFGTLSWVNGEVDQFQGSAVALSDSPVTVSPVTVREPLDRLMPFTAHLGMRWQPAAKPYWVEVLATLADRQDRLSSRDLADTDRIPPGGTPGYTSWTLRGGWEIQQRWVISAALANLTDEEFRIHGSGLNEPGRNLVVSLQRRF